MSVIRAAAAAVADALMAATAHVELKEFIVQSAQITDEKRRKASRQPASAHDDDDDDGDYRAASIICARRLMKREKLTWCSTAHNGVNYRLKIFNNSSSGRSARGGCAVG